MCAIWAACGRGRRRSRTPRASAAPGAGSRPASAARFPSASGVGVIDHGGGAVVRTHVLEAPVHRAQRAQRAQHLLLRLAQQQRRGVDREQVARIEPPEQSGPASWPSMRSSMPSACCSTTLQRKSAAARSERVLTAARVFCTITSPLRSSRFVRANAPAGQGVEERLLPAGTPRRSYGSRGWSCVRLGEDAAREVQAPDAVLHDGVRRALHEAVAAPGIDHLAEQGVEPDGVRRGVRGLGAARAHAVDDRRNEPRLVAQSPEQLVEERGRGGLAVGARNAHQRARGSVAVPRRGQVGHRGVRVLHLDVGHALVRRSGHALAHHGCGAALHRHVDVVVSVALRAADREEAVARLHAARIVDQVRHGPLRGDPRCGARPS